METRENIKMSGNAGKATLLQKVSSGRTERLTLAGDRIIVRVHELSEKSEFAIPLRDIDEDYVECRIPPMWAKVLVLLAVGLGIGATAWSFHVGFPRSDRSAIFLALGINILIAAYLIFRNEIWPGRVFWRFGPLAIQVYPRPKEGNARLFAEKMLEARHEAWKKDVATHAPLAMLGAEISIAEEIRGLYELVAPGVLTKEEFAAKKKELLEKLAQYVPDETDA
ncbi:MAG: SHOCT domain-containing protein [Planctomycetota bacterium]|nr:SHOCT domain-containing protein [Planctomycetota bacterium]